jgi:pyruvate formate lyase activating enzyme
LINNKFGKKGLSPVRFTSRIDRGYLAYLRGSAMLKGIVFNIQRFSTQDGPGVRTTVFLKGCPLRCLWCSNPESQNRSPEVGHRNTLCNRCGLCVDACELKAITVADDGVKIDRKACNNCGKCIEVCVPGALKFYGKEMTVDEVYQEVARDKPFYDNSGGGVTISGGEPLSQVDFTTELLKQCQEGNFHTCIETSGYVDPSIWEKVLPYLNLVLYDVKLFDSAAHKKATGVSNEIILDNLKIVAESGVPVIVRIPVIPGYNDSEENLKATAQYIKSVPGLRKVGLLTYHRLGATKYTILDRKYTLSELTPQEESRMQEMVKIFTSAGLDAEIVK